jgi:hypothetical protein
MALTPDQESQLMPGSGNSPDKDERFRKYMEQMDRVAKSTLVGPDGRVTYQRHPLLPEVIQHIHGTATRRVERVMEDGDHLKGDPKLPIFRSARHMVGLVVGGETGVRSVYVRPGGLMDPDEPAYVMLLEPRRAAPIAGWRSA